MDIGTQQAISTPCLSSRNRALLILVSSLCLLPPLLNLQSLQKLYWFSDDLALLHDLDRLSFLTWLFERFGENIIPVFKLIWGSMVYSFGGYYLPMVSVLWIIHGLIIYKVGHLLLHCRMNVSSTTLACLIIGMAPSQSNLLFFSYHLTAGLCLFFFLCGVHEFLNTGQSLRHRCLFFIFILCSALSFSRGIIFCSALILVLGHLWLKAQSERPQHTSFYLFSTATTLGISFSLLLANDAFTRSTGFSLDQSIQMAKFAWSYWSLSPLYPLLPLGKAVPATWFVPVSFGLLKLAVCVLAIHLAKLRKSMLAYLFFGFILIDLGNTFLLGWGRYAEGIQASLVPRYQRESLLCFVPMAVFVLESLLIKLGPVSRIKNLVLSLATVSCCFSFLRIWTNQFYHHSRWQGSMGRRIIILENLKPKERNLQPPWHGIPPTMNYHRAKELRDRFNLQ